jgi:hypothetical protein
MVFIGTLKRRGKKTPKRYGTRPRLVVLHGVRFYFDKKLILDDEFISKTGLDDPETRPAVIRSLFQNHGIAIRCFGEDEAKPKQTVSVPDVDETGEGESGDD